MGARGARKARGACRNHDEEDDGNHQVSVMGGRANAPRGNMGGAPHLILGGTEFMQRVFTTIKQVVKNTVQTMQVPVRMAESRATMTMKAFLQLRPPTFKEEPDSFVVEDWLEQVTKALDTILVTEEDLRVLFASYQFGLPTEGSAAAVTTEGTISHPGTGTITSQGAIYLFSVWSVWSYQLTVHAKAEELGSYRIAINYSVSSGLEGHSSIYISTDFISVQTTNCSSAGSEDTRTGIRYDLSSGTDRGSWTARATIGYLCCMRYFTYI
ncbi:hypothetical protein Acr_12g0005840 [Actinidia rufa]|uniref:Uncharacterized protein n=1 Tax=Actinidia rufa TaxID=165716 RepID=A0A7J0FHI2_9ERIC|nr:hypothetical protein Acr_12g0005840 [Actinidia rufa]